VDTYQIIQVPLITEKSGLQKSLANQVSFKVHKRANKIEIRQAVERLFKVKVLEVRTINMMGKKRRVGKSFGKRADWKKAVVKLAPGQNIEFFEGL